MARVCIYCKDVQLITGKCEKSARTLLKKVRDAYQKKQHQMLTVEEFCNYLDLPVNHVKEQLRLN